MFEISRSWKLLIRASAVATLAAASGACSSVPDWVDPTTWMGTSSNEPSTTPDSDTASAQAPEGTTVAEASDQYPALADTPDKAPPTTSTDEQKQVANGLAADRSQAQYSAEALRASTVDSPPPPPPAPVDQAPVPDSQLSAASPAVQQASAGESTSSDVAANASQSTAKPALSEALTGRAPMPGTLPAVQSSGPTVDAGQVAMTEPPPAATMDSVSAARPVASAPNARSVTTASVAPPTYAAPATSPQTQDANLGFQPSHAPPLDPSVSQYVPSSVIARYQRTASLSGTPGVAAPAAKTSSRMTASVGYSGNSAGTPIAVVLFPQAGTALSAEGRAQVRAAVDAFRAAGNQGYVRVVGHSANLGNASQDQISRAFEQSQACANAVAQELIKQGVPASKVLVEAVGASDGARRAEIFLQG